MRCLFIALLFALPASAEHLNVVMYHDSFLDDTECATEFSAEGWTVYRMGQSGAESFEWEAGDTSCDSPGYTDCRDNGENQLLYEDGACRSIFDYRGLGAEPTCWDDAKVDASLSPRNTVPVWAFGSNDTNFGSVSAWDSTWEPLARAAFSGASSEWSADSYHGVFATGWGVEENENGKWPDNRENQEELDDWLVETFAPANPDHVVLPGTHYMLDFERQYGTDELLAKYENISTKGQSTVGTDGIHQEPVSTNGGEVGPVGLALYCSRLVEAIRLANQKATNGGSPEIPLAITTVGAHRTSGTAPLSVQFIPTVTHTDSTIDTFKDITCDWSYDDPAGGATWSTTGNSKNTHEGCIGGHVFESAGTFDVSLTVTDKDGNTQNATQEITVTAADTTFSGVNTICYSNAVSEPDWTGCPSGATQIQNVTSANTVIGAMAPGTRVLLKRGDTYTLTATQRIEGDTGPQMLGAWGSGTKPIVTWNNQDPAIWLGSNGNRATLQEPSNVLDDVRFVDIDFDGDVDGSDATEHIFEESWAKNILFLRVDMSDAATYPWELYGNGAYNEYAPDVIDHIAFVESTQKRFNGIGYWLSARKMLTLGSTFQGNAVHTIRVEYTTNALFSNNHVYGSANSQQLNLKWVCGVMDLAGDAVDWFRTYSDFYDGCRQWWISDNEFFAGRGTAPVGLDPTGSSAPYPERIENGVFERNLITTECDMTDNPFGTCDGSGPQRPLEIAAVDIRVRNNVVDMRNHSASSNQCVFCVYRRSRCQPDVEDIWFTNNLVLTDSTTPNGVDMVVSRNPLSNASTCEASYEANITWTPSVDTVDATVVRNNLVYRATGAGAFDLFNFTSNSTNEDTATAGYVTAAGSNPFSGAPTEPSTFPDDYTIDPGETTNIIDQGSASKAHISDLFGTTVPQGTMPDMGPHEQ